MWNEIVSHPKSMVHKKPLGLSKCDNLNPEGFISPQYSVTVTSVKYLLVDTRDVLASLIKSRNVCFISSYLLITANVYFLNCFISLLRT